VWSGGGIWEAKTPPALKQAEMLAPHTSVRRTVEYSNGLPSYTELYSFTPSLYLFPHFLLSLSRTCIYLFLFFFFLFSFCYRQTGGAAPLCHDWSLEKWEAKYLLDTTLSPSSSESVKVFVSTSPSLCLSLSASLPLFLPFHFRPFSALFPHFFRPPPYYPIIFFLLPPHLILFTARG
jgi:hypothetical protein